MRGSRSLRAWLGVTALSLSVIAGVTGCTVQDHHSAPGPAFTTIEFGEITNLGYACGGGAQFSWTVHARETSDEGTAACQQPIDFESYETGATYTFDITGYDGSRVCWQGTCAVPAADATITYADCSGQIAHLCGY